MIRLVTISVVVGSLTTGVVAGEELLSQGSPDIGNLVNATRPPRSPKGLHHDPSRHHQRRGRFPDYGGSRWRGIAVSRQPRYRKPCERHPSTSIPQGVTS